MITIIRELTDITPPSVGYNSLPSPIETTPAADLARINYYRNFLADFDQMKVENTKFNELWYIISEVIYIQ